MRSSDLPIGRSDSYLHVGRYAAEMRSPDPGAKFRPAAIRPSESASESACRPDRVRRVEAPARTGTRMGLGR